MRHVYNVFNIVFRPEDLEQLGTKEKFWFSFTHDTTERWLFKFSRENTGEHWSEKAAEQLCRALHIPHVEYQLAKFGERLGVISKNIVPEGGRLVMGNEVLHVTTTGYPEPQVEQQRFTRVREHTVNRILACLDRTVVLPPVCEYDLEDMNSGDVFCGYLMLDALVSNQDRHHENWAIVLDQINQSRSLCPTYDHASSLGRELTDDDRTQRLHTKDSNQTISAFVQKAKSQLFRTGADAKPLSTLGAFMLAVDRRHTAKNYWLQKLDSLSEGSIREIFAKFPDEIMTEVAKTFAIEMILENKRRLLNYE